MDPRYIRLPIGSKVVTQPPRMSRAWILGQYPSLHSAGKTANLLATNNSSLVFLASGNLVNPVGVVSLFAWQVLSLASYFGVPVVLLIMSFRAKPKYFPQLLRMRLMSQTKILLSKLVTVMVSVGVMNRVFIIIIWREYVHLCMKFFLLLSIMKWKKILIFL